MKWLNQFRLSNTERKGFVALAILLLMVLWVRIGIAFWPEKPVRHQLNLSKEIAIWESEQREKMLVSHRFDPNLVSEEFVQSLKLNKFTKENWLKFLGRKRRFYKAEDLLAIYTMDTLWFEINKDSIFIADDNPRKADKIVVQKFYFDPNSATKAQLHQLGFPDWLAERILSYRAKGGKFKQPEDLLKIYDFPEPLFKELMPYIRIDIKDAPKEIAPQQFVVVEINSADSLMLLNIKGIGPAFAHRIVERRQKLGGFINKNQLLEIYGFDLEKLNEIENQISVDQALIHQLDINKLSFKELNNHPYLNYNQVKAIVGYREKIGPINNVADLINLEGFTEKDIERLISYLSVK